MATARQMRAQSRARVKASRAAVTEAGGSWVSMVISAEATGCLLAMTRTGKTKREVIEAALIERYAKEVKHHD